MKKTVERKVGTLKEKVKLVRKTKRQKEKNYREGEVDEERDDLSSKRGAG